MNMNFNTCNLLAKVISSLPTIGAFIMNLGICLGTVLTYNHIPWTIISLKCVPSNY